MLNITFMANIYKIKLWKDKFYSFSRTVVINENDYLNENILYIYLKICYFKRFNYN